MTDLIRSLNQLADGFHPQRMLEQLGPALSRLLRADRFGIAVPDESGHQFENVGLWDRIDSKIQPGSLFSQLETAASWVREFAYPLVGHSLSDMGPYPGTLEYLHREQFNSNILIPLDTGRGDRAVFYALSRSRGTFSHSMVPVGLRVSQIVEPALQAYLATNELLFGGGDGERSMHTRFIERDEDEKLTLNEVQRKHILTVLSTTNGIIDGPRGAAKILGINPSTLRNRMARLGVERT
jgi:hypothetical protein